MNSRSRFPFGFLCKDISTETVKKRLLQLFYLLGMSNYIQSDRVSSLVLDLLHHYLQSHNVATS